MSQSPFPLNVSPLKMSRVVYGANSVLYAVFVNGEVHEVNIDAKSSKKILSIISDELLLAPSFPQVTWAQVFDPEINGLWSIVTSGSEAYLAKASFSDLSVASWIKLDGVDHMLPDVKFSPETFINAHMVKYDPSIPSQLVVIMESLPTVGFDQIVFVDTTTGALTNIQANLMNDNVLLECPAYECDMWRVSSYDPVNKKLYFQGHAYDGSGYEILTIYQVDFFKNHLTGKWEFLVNPSIQPSTYGYSGFQYVQIVQ